MAGNKFPKGFLWGSATSAYQVEGGNLNSDWEVLFNPKAGLGCDHYRRFEEREVGHYRQVLQALRQRGIRPLVTLHHFTNPLWFFKRGGWENRGAASYFASYVRFVVTQLGDLCDFWVTINEPTVYASEGYLFGRWLPGKRDPLSSATVLKNLLKAHRAAYEIIHEIQPKAAVGISYNVPYFRVPGLSAAFSAFDRKVMACAGKQHFLGINYYRAVGRVGDLPKSDL